MISCSSSGLCFPQSPIFNRSTQPSSISNSNPIQPPTSPIQSQPTRRRKLLNISILTIIVSSSIAPLKSTWAQIQESLDLESYTDTNQGFTLLRPTSWIKVEKAGATVLFEDPNKGGNNVGVVVTPVRLTSLRDFGDPEFVSNKLIQAEKRKESTKDVEIVSFMERGEGIYEFEYKIDSTRGGIKRIFSAAFVASKKLYLLNIAHSDNPQQPISNQTRMMLEQVLHSFAPTTTTQI
ncbi:hypothetical protein L6452_07548 [Arctium lappa]|uniref:Uncharacterized protein n=1 Tax=Arctium lappa TaxID=4217 RepID=A0ACB9EL11_ARCLA|nr:hypothetical protein L6452_07548 [Arctium lappa]